MQASHFKLVTVIADESLRRLIEEEIMALGATGYTVTNVEGRGKTQSRDSAWSGENVKIETIVPAIVCEKILLHLASNYFERYAVIVYCFDVQTVRTEHFV